MRIHSSLTLLTIEVCALSRDTDDYNASRPTLMDQLFDPSPDDVAAYITHLDANCLRNPFSNTYRRPFEINKNFLQATVDLDFIESARHSQDGVPTDVLGSIAIEISYSFAAALPQNHTNLQGHEAKDSKFAPSFEYLPFLDLLIIQKPQRGPTLEQHKFQKILDGIPCTVIAPTPEKYIFVDLDQDRRDQRLREWELGRFLRVRRNSPQRTGILGSLIGFSSPLTEAAFDSERLPNLFRNGSLVDTFWKQARTTQQRSLASTSGVSLRLPSDTLIGKQWYLFGENQGVEFGANIIDAWAASVLIAKLRGDETAAIGEDGVIAFDSVLKSHPGMTVAIADSGCTANTDLLNKLDRLPGCPVDHNDGGRCPGYDYGNDSPDVTVTTESHGTQTAGLIAAESNNVWGISATCPMCKVVCLKIYNDQTKSLSTTAIVRAIEHIAQSGAKISNHSYGGFGDDRLERFAFERLTRGGDHLAFVAAGNAGCNIDCGSQFGACSGKRCSTGQIWTPASYKMPGLVSVASSTKKGTVSMFSNTGAKSVHIFSPGSEIVSIDKRGSPQGTVGSGTSFASPIAAGVAAFIWSVFPKATASEIQKAILTTVRYNPRFEGLAQTSGIIDGFSALDSLWKTLSV